MTVFDGVMVGVLVIDIVGVTEGLTDIVGVTEGVVVLDTVILGVGVLVGVELGIIFPGGGGNTGFHQPGSSGSKSPVGTGSEESQLVPVQGVPVFEPGASPDSKQPPLIKNPFFVVKVKSKSTFVVAC